MENDLENQNDLENEFLVLNKSMDGGIVIKQQECLNGYDPLNHPWKSDCGANCFLLLNYSDRDTSMHLANRTTYGLKYDVMLKIYKNAYQDDSAEWDDIKDKSNDYIKTKLPLQYATIMYVFGSFLSHYVVLLNNDNTLKVLDPQSCSESCCPIDFNEYKKQHNFASIHIIISKPTTEINKVTTEIIDKVLGPEKKWKKNPDLKKTELGSPQWEQWPNRGPNRKWENPNLKRGRDSDEFESNKRISY